MLVDSSHTVTPEQEANHHTYAQIKKLMESADRRLFCHFLDQIDIGLYPLGPLEKSNTKTFIKRRPIYFKRDEIQDFLKQEKHKQLLVACVYGDMKATELYELNDFLDSLGYRRILVMRITLDPGLYILRDTQEDQNSDDCLPAGYHRSQLI